ncbi:hypothetical protein KIW84_062257 [Lathyrus oleraceus]|uniref:Uncharacterized protein n=1 Tax=Pisum sativum TaxID=3888 RepID=A0A9D4W6S4_PEA|nr:hypothetical protein KIW84_062257 [Pisum sativum]
MRPHVRKTSQPRQHQHQVSSVSLVFSNNSNNQSVPIRQQQRQQQPQQRTNYNNNNNNQQRFERKKVSSEPIPMSYAELYPSLVLKNLIQPRNPPQIPEPLPWWFKPELHCAFHQGAPDHDIENYYPLKYEMVVLVSSRFMMFAISDNLWWQFIKTSVCFPKEVEDVATSKKVDIPVANSISTSMCQPGESRKLKTNDDDEVLKLIKRSEFNVMEQLL